MTEKGKLPEKEPMDTFELFKMLHNPELIKVEFPNEYIKSWGKEVWFENNDLYCGKLLMVYQGYWSSKGKFHYHKKKDETFFVIYNSLLLDVEVDGVIRSLVLEPYSSYRIKPYVRHRFTSAGLICHFVEVSTTHVDEDSYRCYWDYEKKKWIDI